MKSKGEGKVAVKKSSGMGWGCGGGVERLRGVAEWSKGSARERKDGAGDGVGGVSQINVIK